MEDKLAQELYSESLLLSKFQLGHSSTADGLNEADIQADDGSLWGDSDVDESQSRYYQLHTIGYREGLMAGKEASAQEGFNIGFKQSVSVGYNWGITRGVTSALACLPAELKERLIETEEKRDHFRELYESVNSLSTTDALRLFHNDILTKKAAEQSESTEDSVSAVDSQKQSSNPSTLGTYTTKLQSLLLESPEIKVQFFQQEASTPAQN